MIYATLRFLQMTARDISLLWDIRRQRLSIYDVNNPNQFKDLKDQVLKEVCIYEQRKQSPHPSIKQSLQSLHSYKMSSTKSIFRCHPKLGSSIKAFFTFSQKICLDIHESIILSNSLTPTGCPRFNMTRP